MILAPPPDLVVSSLQVANNDSLRTGDMINVTYVVSNIGPGPSFESFWSDYIVSGSGYILHTTKTNKL